MVTSKERTRSKSGRPAGLDACASALDWLLSLPDTQSYFTERQYCEAALKFANARGPDEQFRAILEVCNSHEWNDAPPYLGGDARVAGAESLEAARRQFIERLIRVMGHRGKGRRDLAREVCKEGDRVLISERTKVTESGYHIARRVQAFRPSDALAHAILVLINPAYAEFGECLGDELCRCKLPSCEQFFFAYRIAKSGPPRREYCCASHSEEARRADGARRTRRSRAKSNRARNARNRK